MVKYTCTMADVTKAWFFIWVILIIKYRSWWPAFHGANMYNYDDFQFVQNEEEILYIHVHIYKIINIWERCDLDMIFTQEHSTIKYRSRWPNFSKDDKLSPPYAGKYEIWYLCIGAYTWHISTLHPPTSMHWL